LHFFRFFAKKGVQKPPKRGPKWGPGGGHSQAVIAKREVFFSVLKKTVDTFSENIHAAFDAVTPPYPLRKNHENLGQDRTDNGIEKVHGSEWALRAIIVST